MLTSNGYLGNQAYPHSKHYEHEDEEMEQATETESLNHTNYGGISQHPDQEDMTPQASPFYHHHPASLPGVEPQFSNYNSADVTHRSQSSNANSDHSQQYYSHTQHQQQYGAASYNPYYQHKPVTQYTSHQLQYNRQFSTGSLPQQQQYSPLPAAGTSQEQLDKTVYADQEDGMRASPRNNYSNKSNNNNYHSNLQEQFFNEGKQLHSGCFIM